MQIFLYLVLIPLFSLSINSNRVKTQELLKLLPSEQAEKINKLAWEQLKADSIMYVVIYALALIIHFVF